MTGADAPRVRVRAPELRGRVWLNTGGGALSLQGDLRGRIVLLDFWSYCCLNCLHVLDELRPVEEKYREELVVIGVHSPKFVHEAEPAAIAAAVERYDVAHPVLDDPDLITWSQYAVRAWPTLVLIDPDGYIVAQYSGEGHAHAIDAAVAELVRTSTAAGTLRRGTESYVAPTPQQRTLSYPAKVLPLPDGSLLVADAARHSLALLAADGETLLRRIGSGDRGLVDGDPSEARFSEPGAACLLPPEVAAQVGYDIVVADTVNHALRGVDTSTWSVRTVAGTGEQWMRGDVVPHVSAPTTPMSSPWDVAWSPSQAAVVIAMAGIHQLWSFDPLEPSLSVLAGTTSEGLLDGPASRAWLAQPSGIAVIEDIVYFVDAETSALRHLSNGVVNTDVGTGLFDFGCVDGAAPAALFQHPLGLCPLPDGSLAIADTYNGAIRRYDPSAKQVSTLATGLAEPSDVVVVPDLTYGHVLLVVESNAHRLTRLPLEQRLTVAPQVHQVRREPIAVRPGAIDLLVVFEPPVGQHLDDRYGPSTFLTVSATPGAALAVGGGDGTDLVRHLTLQRPGSTGTASTGPAPPGTALTEHDLVLHVSVRAASCDDVSDTNRFPACHVHQQDWGVPVRFDDDGAQKITLVLSG